MMRLVLLEPELPGEAWQPFSGVRPLAELRAGARKIRERWAAIVGLDDIVVMGDHCADFADIDAAPVLPRGPVHGPAIVVRSDFAPDGPSLELSAHAAVLPRRLAHERTTVGWLVAPGETWEGPHETGEAAPVEGLLLRGAFDLITALERLLPGDCADYQTHLGDPVPDGCIVLGESTGVVCLGAEVEPGTVFDVRRGAVVLEEGVYVQSGTRLEGPLYVGAGTLLLGGEIRQSAIGPLCRVHGEVATSVFLGYANKSHDGFVGHSVLGHWVNLGAGTITSNLKNTYGEIRLDAPAGRLDTGRTNLGTLFGDHAKTAIGSMLSTGSVVGAGANVFGAPVPRWVRPFAWGAAGEEQLQAEGFVTIARRVMPRRRVDVTPEIEASLRALHRRMTG
jgi:UDP-N-acetylglucosamine diphosphorylase/glucosamine-1-phosphate N-acetyltransferase